MTKLFQEIAGSRTQNQPGSSAGNSSREFIEQAAKQGFKLNVADFMRFARMAKGRDMGEIVRELRESGQIDETQYQKLEQQAKGFLGMIQRIMK